MFLFVDFLVVLAALSPRPTGMSVLLCRGSRIWPAGAMDQAALQGVTLARPSGTLCGTAQGAREQQRLRTWIVFFFFGSEVIRLAHSSGEWCFFWISWLTQWYCYAAMHCRYFAETKTLWKHLNSPAATTQVLRPRDSACFGEEFTGMASMSSDITMRC